MNFTRQIIDNKINRLEILSAKSPDKLLFDFKEGSWSLNNTNESIPLDKVYFTDGQIEFKESGKMTSAGMLYQFSISIKMPTNFNRVHIMQSFRIANAIKLRLCNGKYINIGRNDVYQNKRIIAEFMSNDKFTTIEYIISKIAPFDFE